jgi:DNA (cytosine-5)-methyltransferase 1
MRYLSLFSGIEAATVAWHPLGWTPLAFSEIEPFPCEVLKHHYPTVRNMGDVSKFKEWPDFGTVDLVVGGAPCQAFSVAGLRAGLADPRGNLTLTYLAVIDRYRPQWVLFENVPGILSSTSDDAPDPSPPPDPVDMELDGQEVVIDEQHDAEETHAFSAFLAGLRELGYGFAYRVLDAQYIRVDGFPHAVPQRRRRVFVVGYLGDWRRAAAVFFDTPSLRGDPAPRREAGKGVAPTISSRPTGGGGPGTDFDLGGGLIANSGDVGYCLTASAQQSLDAETETLVAHALRAEGFDASEDGTGRGTPIVAVAPTLRAGGNSTGGDRPYGTDVDTCESLVPIAPPLAASLTRGAESAGKGGYAGRRQEDDSNLVAQPVAFDTTQITSKANRSQPKAGDPCHPLAAGAHPPAIAFDARQSDVLQYGDKAGPIDTDAFSQAVAFDMRGREDGAQLEGPHDTANIRAASGGSSRSYVAEAWAVRRLTPMECERLQGFPDGYTDIPRTNGKPAADGPRYKALGNSMATNAMRWIGERIAMVDAIE